MDFLNYELPLWAVLIYYVASNAIGAMPSPKPESSDFYKWAFVFLNSVAANLSRAGFGMRKNGNGTQITPPVK